MNHPLDDAPAGGLEHVNFDPLAVLERDSKILLNPRFLTALHAEMEAELGVEQGRVTLFQMGFLHGLQDASRALEASCAVRRTDRARGITPPLRMDLRSPTATGDPHVIELHGCWPDRHEAAAHLSELGKTTDPSCFLSAGYCSGWLSGSFEANLVALEVACGAAREFVFNLS